MNIAERAVIRPHLSVQTHWAAYACLAFALVALALTYLASAGPGLSAAELAKAVVFP